MRCKLQRTSNKNLNFLILFYSDYLLNVVLKLFILVILFIYSFLMIGLFILVILFIYSFLMIGLFSSNDNESSLGRKKT